MSAAHRHPPAFRIELASQPLLQGLVALLAAVSAASLVAGLCVHLLAMVWLSPVVPLVAVSAWRYSRIEARLLQWDGQVWRLAAAGELDPGDVVDIDVVFDLGTWLLLRTQRPGAKLPRRHYLPLARSQLGAAWGQLRATIYSARPERASVA